MNKENSANSDQFYCKMKIPFVENLEKLKEIDAILHGYFWALRSEDLKNHKQLIEEIATSNLRVELANNYILVNRRKFSVHISDIYDAEGKFGLKGRDNTIKKLKKTIYQKLDGKDIYFYKPYVSLKDYIEHVILPLNVLSMKEQQKLLFDANFTDDKIEAFVSTFDRAREIKRINSAPLPAIVHVKDQLGLNGEYKASDLPMVIGSLNNSIREQTRMVYYKDREGFDKALPILKKRMIAKNKGN